MRRVFVDTGAFFALLSADDAHHARFTAHFATASRERWKLVTTNFVLAETHALVLHRAPGGAQTALRFIEGWLDGEGHLERVSRADERLALTLLRARVERRYSFCDATSFVVMDRLHLREVLSPDGHFRERPGFIVL